ncbi:class F sortase [Actinoplanes sp. NPDC051859]|uniref:class F sortase n=1 Tax=Actinoplanes sp. NPDC051859 TaxID=3363909 RepID=UPI0037B9F296
MSDTAASGPPPKRRRERYLLPAMTLAFTLLGFTALAIGVRQSLHEPDLPATTASAPNTPSPAATPGTRSGTLTTGPLMDTSVPTRVSIPALKVSVPVTGLGQQADGSMQVPGDAATVGWYTKAPTPGALGPAILAGHVDYQGQLGTFARLSKLKPADLITVRRRDGSTATFSVTAVKRHPKDKFPTDAVYGPINHAGLRLITCGGDFDNDTGHYEDNIVVYAILRTAQPAA